MTTPGNPKLSTPHQALRDYLLRRVFRELQRSHPDYVAAIRECESRGLDDAAALKECWDAKHKAHGVPPVEPWERLTVLVFDYEMRLDAVRLLNETIRSSEDSRLVFHLTNQLFVAAHAAVDAVDGLVKALRRAGVITLQSEKRLRGRISNLLKDEVLQNARTQVAHPASHLEGGKGAWVWSIAAAGHVQAAAVMNEDTSMGPRTFIAPKMPEEEMADWKLQSGHIFSTLRVAGGDVLRDAVGSLDPLEGSEPPSS